ncbi:hypothetical protein K9L97_05685 [Candidatus Woesearchaeota archaeon]|nr:hypothetical protein [Candidatus Woesearchaeota archaeon]
MNMQALIKDTKQINNFLEIGADVLEQCDFDWETYTHLTAMVEEQTKNNSGKETIFNLLKNQDIYEDMLYVGKYLGDLDNHSVNLKPSVFEKKFLSDTEKNKIQFLKNYLSSKRSLSYNAEVIASNILNDHHNLKDYFTGRNQSLERSTVLKHLLQPSSSIIIDESIKNIYKNDGSLNVGKMVEKYAIDIAHLQSVFSKEQRKNWEFANKLYKKVNKTNSVPGFEKNGLSPIELYVVTVGYGFSEGKINLGE